ncbi:MAG: polyprenyl diphosphate synthase [bacterium]|nr:polyprenyl diphosphate synthase [bacterium]
MDENLPHHVAIIPDGNRRWAKARGLPSFEGHRRGFDIASKICRAAREMDIHTLTLWAFSTENWNRSSEEITYLMKLYEILIDQNLKEAKEDGVRIYHLGRKDRLPTTLLERLARAEEETKGNDRYVLNVALDYGGQDEILRAIKKAVELIIAGKMSTEKLFEETGKYRDKYPYYFFKNFLDTRDQPYPYPDLIIRTSNEKRLSGLYCWQGAYAEVYWEKDHFPDFTPEKLHAALEDFSQRHRRFGGN